MYRELFPSSKLLFVYRDVEKVARSVYRSTMVTPTMVLVCKLGKLSRHVTRLMIDSMGLNGSDFCVRFDTHNDLVLGVVISAVITTFYLDMRRRGFDIRAVRYEDLIARPLDMCRVVLEFCHLPVSLAELAVKAFEVDSQRNCHLAKSLIGHFREPELTTQTKAKLNELLKKHGVPLIGEPGIIEGTLTCS